MKLWKLAQDKNTDYDTFDSAVVAAETEQEAKETAIGDYGRYGTWVAPEFVNVELIGEATMGIKKGIIISSFNAG